MSEKLEFTGERFTPECEREIWYEHFHRYVFAARWSRNARVLDAACGEGYGAALLARSAAAVRGVDISARAIEHARDRYGGFENLGFEVADCTRLPFDDGGFDMVVSFETLEHLSEQESLLAEFRRVLHPEGFLVLSSPDKAVYSERHGFSNPFHARELYRDELEQMVSRCFPAKRVLGQKLLFHSAIWTLEEVDRVTVQTAGDGELAERRVVHEPMYYIVLCAGAEEYLPPLEDGLWLFDDAAESVYRHYQHEIRKNMAAGGILAEREAEIEVLRDQARNASPAWWRRWFGGG